MTFEAVGPAFESRAELAETYVDSPKGQPPVPPARMALATILQVYTNQRR